MPKFVNLCSGMLLIPDADIKLGPGDTFVTDSPTKQTYLAVQKELLKEVKPGEEGDKRNADSQAGPSNDEPERGKQASGPRGRIRTTKT